MSGYNGGLFQHVIPEVLLLTSTNAQKIRGKNFSEIKLFSFWICFDEGWSCQVIIEFWFISVMFFYFQHLLRTLFEVVKMDMPPSTQWYCRLQLYNFYSSFLCSCYLLIVMTFERFYSIIRPHKAASFNTVKKARITILCIFMIFFPYSIPYLFISGYDGAFCVPILFSNNLLIELYYWLTEILIFYAPFLSLLTMNSVIIHTLRKRSKLNILGSGNQSETDGEHLRNKHPDKQIVTMFLLVTFVFLILNIPVRTMVFYLNYSSGDSPQYHAGLHFLYQVGQKAFYTNHGINFFLYVISGQKFRTDLKNLFVSKKFNKK